MECLNCKTVYEGKFCPECGQKRETKPFTLQKITNDTFTSITNADKGLLFNLKNLTLNPGEHINNYLDGKRKQVFNPFSYALLAIGLYLFLEHYYSFSIFKSLNNPDTDVESLNSGAYDLGQKIGHFTNKYLKFFYLLNIVYLSLITWLILRKRNFVEHLVINAFIVGHAVLLSALLIPIYKIPIIFNPFTILSIAILMYFVYRKYEEKLVILVAIFFAILTSFILQFVVPGIFIWLENLIF